MEFCDKCGSLLRETRDSLICPKCGYQPNKSSNKSSGKRPAQDTRQENHRLKSNLKEARSNLAAITNINIPIPCPNCYEKDAGIEIRNQESPSFVCASCGYRWEPDEMVFKCPACNHKWGGGVGQNTHKQSGEEKAPVDLGEDYEITIDEITEHHSGDQHFVGHYEGFKIFITQSPEKLAKGDTAVIRITSFGKGGTSANAKVVENSSNIKE